MSALAMLDALISQVRRDGHRICWIELGQSPAAELLGSMGAYYFPSGPYRQEMVPLMLCGFPVRLTGDRYLIKIVCDDERAKVVDE